MGANYESMTYLIDDKDAIKSYWEADVNYSQSMDGCSYSGAIGMLDESIDWVRVVPFNSQNEADEYISENARKWSGPMAVPFKIQGGKAVPAYVKNAKEKYDKAQEKQRQIVEKISQDIFDAKSKFIGCKNCNSKINRSFLRLTDCPICNAELLSTTSLQRIENAKKKVSDMLSAWKAANVKAREQNCTGKIGYVIGGICPS